MPQGSMLAIPKLHESESLTLAMWISVWNWQNAQFTKSM